MKTKRSKISKNKTKKNKHDSALLKIIKVGSSLYASKSFEGSEILKYDTEQVNKYNDKCLPQVSGWFGDLEVAKSYKTKDNHIYRWKFKKETKLLDINKENRFFISNIFTTSKKHLTTTINLTKTQIGKINYEHSYLNMSQNAKALYEFNFCFGFLTLEEQYEFMKLIEYLIKNKFIDILTREGKSILKKLLIKINYYKLNTFFIEKNNNLNRLSFYDFDKHAILNLCKLVNNNKYNICGVYQKNAKSFWFPDLIVYKMNIKEVILFNPPDNLVYDKLIE
jgi:hypothetical protein